MPESQVIRIRYFTSKGRVNCGSDERHRDLADDLSSFQGFIRSFKLTKMTIPILIASIWLG